MSLFQTNYKLFQNVVTFHLPALIELVKNGEGSMGFTSFLINIAVQTNVFETRYENETIEKLILN